MKNYTYGWRLKELGCVEVPESEYTDRQKEMKAYIDFLSAALAMADCGWDGVKYKVMSSDKMGVAPYMVLYIGNHGERWIPVDGNSKGCCFSVLGENLW